MKFFEPQRGRGREPVPTLVDQAVTAVQQAIKMQVLKVGMRMPSIRRFAALHELSAFTVSAAYSRLVAQGWLLSRPGAGYWVARRYDALPDSTAEAGAHQLRQDIQAWRPPKVGERWLLEDVFADHSIPIKSGCGWLPSDWLSASGLDAALRDLARVPVGQLGSYGHPYGYLPLREFICQQLRDEGLMVDTQQVLLTQGATQALDLVFRSLLQPGDTVLVEQPCYANVLPMLRMAGAQVVSIERQPHGFDMRRLEQLLATQRVRAFFLNPVLHNPTGSNLAMEQAFQLLTLTQRHGVWVIEDDVSRRLAQGHAPLLAAMAGMEQVVYVSSFSKSIAPSTRVGFVVSNQAFTELLASRKMALGLTTPELMERLVYRVVGSGRYGQHVASIQARLMQAHQQVYEQLDALDYEVFTRPYEGLFVWARPRHALATQEQSHAQPTTRLAEQALKAGIWLAPGSYFYPDGRDEGWLRFNVAHSLAPELWRFLEDR